MNNETNPGTLDQATINAFWSKVDKRSDDECWEWLGPRANPKSGAPSGYGRIYIRRKINQAHRVSYELVNGPIPEGLVLDHLCRNPCCVNPAHLEPVSQQENVLRGEGRTARNAAKTHCVNGHPLVGDNLIARTRKFRNYTGVERNCRQCQTERKRDYRREDGAKLESYKQMREIAISTLGYESILEALEAAPPSAQSQPAATVQEVEDAESPCTDCGDTGIAFQTERPCTCDAAARQAPTDERQELVDLIRTRLLGIRPEDQDIELEDDDWRTILAALTAEPAAKAGDAVVLADGFEAEQDGDTFTIRFPSGFAVTAWADGKIIITRYPQANGFSPFSTDVAALSPPASQSVEKMTKALSDILTKHDRTERYQHLGEGNRHYTCDAVEVLITDIKAALSTLPHKEEATPATTTTERGRG